MRILRSAAAVIVLVAAAAAVYAAAHRPAPDSVSGVLTIERDGYRYAYQVITGAECLFDLAADPGELRNLAASRPELTQALRAELEASLDVDRLEALREGAGHADTIRRLKALGYL